MSRPGDGSPPADRIRRGIGASVSAYALWGFFPLYFALLAPAGPLEILAHRIVWSFVFTWLVVLVARRVRILRAALTQRRTLLLLVAAGWLIAVNWGVYIYGVVSGQVVETSLGYFINPLVSVALGVAVFGERLRRAQWVAVGIAVLAVIVLAVDYGRPPYLALILAFSFATYGLVKKVVAVPALEGLAVESAALTGPAVALLVVLAGTDSLTFGSEGPLHTALLLSAGVVTAVPLLFFAAGAARVPLSTLGLLQYLTPSLQLALALTVFDEPLPPGRLAGFALVWLALLVFTVDLLRHRRRPAPLPPPAG